MMLNSIELFAGAGGLGMGVGLAGFSPKAVIEWDTWACDTIRENIQRGFPLVRNWPLIEDDVREFDFESLEDRIDLVVGGPPCQPFSLGGKHRAHNDERDMFPATVDAVRRLRPKAFIVENVRGLTRAAFNNYYQYILLQFTYPEVRRRTSETWVRHLTRLEKIATTRKKRGLTYNVVHRILNAANYGVPQKRDRVFIVGFRSDMDSRWSFPDETHSFEALLEDQWVTGEYWERHRIPKKKRPQTPERYNKRIEKIRLTNERPMAEYKPWRTLRDALQDVPDPRERDSQKLFRNHRFQDGARPYPGHTGSPLDLPSKALKAGDHGVPGGENMMVMGDGSVRYLTVREAARVQTFPDGYVFHGSWSETMRQLGNAVPVKLALVVAGSVAKKLLEQEQRDLERLIHGLAK